MSKLRGKRLKQSKKIQQAKDKFFKGLNPDLGKWSAVNVERRAASHHMQDRTQAGRLYSLPLQYGISFPQLQHRLQSLQVDQQPRTDLDREDLSLSLNNGMLPVQEVPTLFFRVSTRAPARHRTLPLPAAAGMKLSSTDMLPCTGQFRAEMHAGCKWRRAELRRLLRQCQRYRFAAQMRGAFHPCCKNGPRAASFPILLRAARREVVEIRQS